MLVRRVLIPFLLLSCLVGLSCCHTGEAHSAPLGNASSSPQTQVQRPSPPLRKHPPRDSAISTYNNPSYGLAFSYPRNYLLDDSSVGEGMSIIEGQQDLAAEQPGALVVAAVTIPPDAYPNTTFQSATLELVVTPAATPEACQSLTFGDERTSRSGSLPAQTVIFNWRQQRSVSSAPGTLHREYAAFRSATCYEFFLQIVTAPNPETDPALKPFDDTKILRHLEKIISSLQIHSDAPAAHPPKP